MKKIVISIIKVVLGLICFVFANHFLELKFEATSTMKEVLYGSIGLLLMIPFYKTLLND